MQRVSSLVIWTYYYMQHSIKTSSKLRNSDRLAINEHFCLVVFPGSKSSILTIYKAVQFGNLTQIRKVCCYPNICKIHTMFTKCIWSVYTHACGSNLFDWLIKARDSVVCWFLQEIRPSQKLRRQNHLLNITIKLNLSREHTDFFHQIRKQRHPRDAILRSCCWSNGSPTAKFRNHPIRFFADNPTKTQEGAKEKPDVQLCWQSSYKPEPYVYTLSHTCLQCV